MIDNDDTIRLVISLTWLDIIYLRSKEQRAILDVAKLPYLYVVTCFPT